MLLLPNTLAGHEIAAHSITHSSNEKYWSEASVEQWAKEMAGVSFSFQTLTGSIKRTCGN